MNNDVQRRLTKNDRLQIPATHLPSFRTSLAAQNKVQNNILIHLWGGLGDQICAEPTLRWAVEGGMSNCEVTIATNFPELFTHLKFKDVYNLNHERPIFDDYLTFETITQPNETSLTWQFMSHMLTNCVDFPSLCAFRFTLPNSKKEIVLKPERPSNPELLDLERDKKHHVLIHAGRHWESKTFPVDWWDETIEEVKKAGFVPVLIGKDGGPTQGYVATTNAGCVDLRDKTTTMESVWLTQNLPVIICSDSAPMHMAASGNAFIGYLATVKEPDYIMHWRKGQWAWRMQNFALGGMWELFGNLPNSQEDILVDKVDVEILKKWLPNPQVFGPWAREKMNEYFK